MLIKFSVLKIFLIVLIVETSWVLSMEPKMASTLNMPMKSTSLGSLYRSPHEGFARNSDGGGSSSILGSGRTGRFFSDYFGRNPTYNYANRYNAYDRNSNNNNYEDRNWYYQPDRYDNRYWYDDRYGNRYDDRYDAYNRPSTYDRYDSRYPSTTYQNNNYDYRGNGYDNRDSVYYDRDRYNTGDRYDSRTYYDRDSYDRYPMTSRYGGYNGYYDYKNYRPWDETYRGVSGFDNSGRGYYFANNPRDSYPSRPPSQSSPMGSTSPYRPSQSQSSYQNDRDHQYYNSNSNSNHQAPPRPIQSASQQPNNKPNYDNNSSSGSNSDNNNYNNSNNNNNNSSNYNKNTNSNDNDRVPDRVASGSQKPSYAGGWDYNTDSDRSRDSNRPMLNMPPPPPQRGQYYPDDRREMEQTGNPYGTRTRPILGSMGNSYLHDRDTNTPADGDIKSQSQDAQQTSNNNEVKGSLIKIEENEK